MSDAIERPPVARQEVNNPSPKLVAETQTSPWGAVTDMTGRECKQQPGAGQFPLIPFGQPANGCEYQSGNSNGMPFDTKKLFDNAVQSTVRILTPFTDGRQTRDGQGSGVVMAKGDNACYVATVNHNVSYLKDVGLKPVGDPQVVMPDGKKYPATVVDREFSVDRATLKVATGANTDSVCKPASFANPPQPGDKGLLVGFPGDTTYPHASLTEYKGLKQMSAALQKVGFRGSVTDNQAHTRGGNSGGPMFNLFGQVHSLVEGTGPGVNGANRRKITLGVPISEVDVQNIMRRIQGK